MFQSGFQAQQGVRQKQIQMLLTDLLKGVGLYFDSRNLVNVFCLVREEDAAAEIVGQGVVLIGIDDRRAGEADGYFLGWRTGRGCMLQREVQIVRDHAQNHQPVIVHLAFQVVVIGFSNEQGNIHQI